MFVKRNSIKWTLENYNNRKINYDVTGKNLAFDILYERFDNLGYHIELDPNNHGRWDNRMTHHVLENYDFETKTFCNSHVELRKSGRKGTKKADRIRYYDVDFFIFISLKNGDYWIVPQDIVNGRSRILNLHTNKEFKKYYKGTISLNKMLIYTK
jgi:hypothetical protein